MDNMTMEQKRDELLRVYLEDLTDYVHDICYGVGWQMQASTINRLDADQKREYVSQKRDMLRRLYEDLENRFNVFAEAGMFSKDDEAQWEYVIKIAYKEGRRAIGKRFYKNENWYKTFLSDEELVKMQKRGDRI